MSGEGGNRMRRLVVKVWAYLPEDWRGRAGERFRQTTNAITDYANEHLRLGERVDEAPDLAWRAVQGAATQKHSEAVLNYAKEEDERIKIELDRRTLEARVRKEVAEARKLESEARTQEIREFEARIELVDKLRRVGALPVGLGPGRMAIIKAPEGFDWDALVSEKLINVDEQVKMFSLPSTPLDVQAGDSIGVPLTDRADQQGSGASARGIAPPLDPDSTQ